jgi:hypothetical protein
LPNSSRALCQRRFSVSPWYTRQDRDRDHDSVRVRAFALEALEQLKASFAVVSESALVRGL